MKNVLFLLAFLCAINLWGQSGAIPPPATDTATWSKIKIKTAMNNFSE
ncbi:MAG: hypothetical protein RL757_2715, partial [Bacteroidota bacterium]